MNCLAHALTRWHEDGGPMPLLGIVVGAWLLALGATGWAVGRMWRQAWA